MNEALERILISNDWVTVVLTTTLALLVYNKIRYMARFQSLQSLLYNNAYINNYSKAIPLVFNSFNITFIIIFIVTFSLLLFVTADLTNVLSTTNTKGLFLMIISYVSSFVVVRFIIGFLLAVLFEKEKEQQYYTFIKISYLSNFCLFMLPLLVINFYIDSVLFSKFLVIVAILLLLFYYFLQIKNNQKIVFSRIFYFILYLCALEISPFIIIYKFVIK